MRSFSVPMFSLVPMLCFPTNRTGPYKPPIPLPLSLYHRRLPTQSSAKPTPMAQSTAKPTPMASSTRRDQVRRKGIRSMSNQDGDEQGETRMPRVYLVFDDWPLGHSIREVIPPACPLDPQPISTAASVKPLPPPVMRLEARYGLTQHFASAFGTKIVAMHGRSFEGNSIMFGSFSTMFDVCERSLAFCPGQFYPLHPIYFSVSDKLFCLSRGCFEMFDLSRALPVSRSSSWLMRSNSIHSFWIPLENPPFKRFDVTSYALHPQKATFFVSTKIDATEATFAFDTKNLRWELVGNLAMPFTGRGHFDQRNDLLVGLSQEPDTLGQLCGCNFHSYPRPGRHRVTALQEKLFSQNPLERHVGATLVYMGSSEFSKYCLVQCVFQGDSSGQELKIEGDSDAQELKERGSFLYRLTTFDLGLSIGGGLTTGKTGQVRYYQVPDGTSLPFLVEDPVAFAM